NAYSLAGIPSTSTFSYVETRRFVAATRKGTISRVLDLCHSRGATAIPIGGRARLVLNGAVRVQIVVIRCRGGRATRARWKFSIRSISDVDFVIGVQLAVDNQSILQYLLIPFHAMNGDMTFREELPREHVDLSYARLEDMFLVR
ncbi:MAG: hypothetical protein Q7T55_11295, partial [Solirubrobacteraceae bacterium]|nr:hypothetical protein [Solirubrobacteraceae bacterium]